MTRLIALSSPLTYFSLAIASGVFDFYAEGIAIKKQ
jgi:hypothetical protein